jgi:biopolymer transport protein ExbD
MFKFSRQHQIFRGQFQAAPFAAVFLLFLIFFLFNTSIVYIPGLPLQLGPDQTGDISGRFKTVRIEDNQVFRFGRETLSGWDQFAARLRAHVRTNAAMRGLVIQSAPDTTNGVVRQVVQLARDLNLTVDLPGARLDLPVSDSLVMATNPVITLAINVSGQMYYQSQVISEARLEAELRAAVDRSRQPLTLMIMADQHVEYDLIIHATAAARAAGLRQVLLATRPAPYAEIP